MDILFLLLPLSLVLVTVIVGVVVWAVQNGQFDDLSSPAWRILEEDDADFPGPEGSKTSGKEKK